MYSGTKEFDSSRLTLERSCNTNFIKGLLSNGETEKEFISFYDEISAFIDDLMEITDQTEEYVQSKLSSYVEFTNDFNSIKLFFKNSWIFCKCSSN